MSAAVGTILAKAPVHADGAITLTQGSQLEIALKTGVADFVGEVRFSNAAPAGEAPRSFRLSPKLTRVRDRASQDAHWQRQDARDVDASLPSGAEAVLLLSATLDRPGAYETWIDTFRADPKFPSEGAPERRIHVVVTREANAVPSDLLLQPGSSRAVWPWNYGRLAELLTLRNSSVEPLEIGSAAVLSFDNGTGAPRRPVTGTSAPLLDSSGCASPLAPGTSCALLLSWPGHLEPGTYAVEVGLGGPGGGWSQKSMTLSVRCTWWLAFVLTIAGAAGGWYIQFWRASGRRAFDSLIALGEMKDRLRGLVVADRLSRLAPLAGSLSTDIDGVAERCKVGADVSHDLDALASRLARLSSAGPVETSFYAVASDMQMLLAPLHVAFFQAVAASEAGSDFDKLRGSVASNLNAVASFAAARGATSASLATADALLTTSLEPGLFGPLMTARGPVADLLVKAREPLAADAAPTALSDQTSALRTAQAKFDEQLGTACQAAENDLRGRAAGIMTDPQASESTKRRAQTVQDRLSSEVPLDARSRVDRLKELAAVLQDGAAIAEDARPKGSVPTTVPPSAPGIDLPVADFLGTGLSLLRLRHRRKANELVTNALVLVGIGATGVLAVASNEAWGSWPDILNLLLAGLASRVVLGEVGSAITQATGH